VGQSQGIFKTKQLAEEYAANAVKALSYIDDSEARSALNELTAQVLLRRRWGEKKPRNWGMQYMWKKAELQLYLYLSNIAYPDIFIHIIILSSYIKIKTDIYNIL